MSFSGVGLATRLTILTVGLLLIGQLVNAGLLATAEKTLRMQRAEAVMAERLVQGARFIEAAPRLGPNLARRPGVRLEEGPPPAGEVLPRAEETLRQAMEEAGFQGRGHAVRLVERGERQVMIGAIELSSGSWLSYRRPLPPGGDVPWGPIIVQTLILSVILIIPAIWVGRAVATPLRQLTGAADSILTGKDGAALPEGGPPDIRALTSAIAKLEQRVLAALDERAAMLGALGHDLRTPLASLRIRVESVADETLREEMTASIEALAEALDDILTFSKGVSADQLEEVRTEALVARLLEDYRGQPVSRGPVEALQLRASPQSLLRALRNLLDNALRYGGEAELSVEKRPGGMVAFVIRDKGEGIAAADLERLQRPFERGDPARNSAERGTGLGLAIAGAVARAHAGELLLTNGLSGGLEAVLLLPYHKAV
ncbi:sensor histidine kinase [Parvularcula lutaonensis]|uniref:histidine kinase n=1 Tax=Parvularcula lutaonensis TaxID=491923 RepID=A0ABV7MEG7_9PROT|nr:ATP-binding protein [Parvularcula lutaonensis]GGY51815.1 hypothetical protein GCM10007148_20930 [Parvularcula lutaonensis]